MVLPAGRGKVAAGWSGQSGSERSRSRGVFNLAALASSQVVRGRARTTPQSALAPTCTRIAIAPTPSRESHMNPMNPSEPTAAAPGWYTDPDLSGLDDDLAELAVQVVDVDQVLEVGQSELHHRQQAVASGHEPRRITEPVQQPDRLVHAGRSLVLERCRNLHAQPLVLVADWHIRRPPGRNVNSGLSDPLVRR